MKTVRHFYKAPTLFTVFFFYKCSHNVGVEQRFPHSVTCSSCPLQAVINSTGVDTSVQPLISRIFVVQSKLLVSAASCQGVL